MNTLTEVFDEPDQCVRSVERDRGPNGDTARYGLLDKYKNSRGKLTMAVNAEFKIIEENSKRVLESVPAVSEVAQSGLKIANAIEEIRHQFTRLSESIRTDHRFMYKWYDKNLSYIMFAAATLASGWNILKFAWLESAPAISKAATLSSGWVAIATLLAAAALIVLGLRRIRR